MLNSKVLILFASTLVLMTSCSKTTEKKVDPTIDPTPVPEKTVTPNPEVTQSPKPSPSQLPGNGTDNIPNERPEVGPSPKPISKTPLVPSEKYPDADPADSSQPYGGTPPYLPKDLKPLPVPIITPNPINPITVKSAEGVNELKSIVSAARNVEVKANEDLIKGLTTQLTAQKALLDSKKITKEEYGTKKIAIFKGLVKERDEKLLKNKRGFELKKNLLVAKIKNLTPDSKLELNKMRSDYISSRAKENKIFVKKLNALDLKFK